ncbi:MAG: CapA family protein, partial [Halioglobus sp.]|nr:CapA family protein [Halioglobus sp.]
MTTGKSREMSVVAAGSAMYTRRVSVSTNEKFLEVVKLIRDNDVSFVNMEGHIGHPDAYPLKPYSFASYYAGEPWVAEEYKWTGFNLAALANNHASDWSPDSLYETQQLLDECGIVHAGTGKNLTAAR